MDTINTTQFIVQTSKAWGGKVNVEIPLPVSSDWDQKEQRGGVQTRKQYPPRVPASGTTHLGIPGRLYGWHLHACSQVTQWDLFLGSFRKFFCALPWPGRWYLTCWVERQSKLLPLGHLSPGKPTCHCAIKKWEYSLLCHHLPFPWHLTATLSCIA